jgi:phosphate acetyltransferase
VEKKIFIASTERYSGKSLVAIGLINTLRGIVPEVGYMKPICQKCHPGSIIDEDAVLIKSTFNLGDDLNDINPLSMNEVQRNRDTLFEKIFDAYNHLSKGKDIVVIEGTDYTSTLAALEFDINAHLAQSMSAPVLLVANGASRSVDIIIENLVEVTESIREMGCKFLGAVINRFNSKRYFADLHKIEETLHSRGIHLFGAIPSNPILSGPRLRDVADELGAEVVFKGDNMSKVVTDTKILAMTPEHSLEYIKDQNGYLLIIPGDRMDNIFAVMSAQRSLSYPRYSGILLTGGLVPESNIRDLLLGISDSSLTILSVKDDTYITALKVDKITGELKPDDKEKIELVCQLVEKHVNIEQIYSELGSVETNITTPQMFEYRILETAKVQTMHIVLPEGTEPRIIQAAGKVLESNICRLTLLGNVEKMTAMSKSLGVDITRAGLLDPTSVDKKIFNDYVDTLYQARKHKGCTKEMAADLTYNLVYYATIMVHRGDADGFVSGTTHPSSWLILQLQAPKPQGPLESNRW